MPKGDSIQFSVYEQQSRLSGLTISIYPFAAASAISRCILS